MNTAKRGTTHYVVYCAELVDELADAAVRHIWAKNREDAVKEYLDLAQDWGVEFNDYGYDNVVVHVVPVSQVEEFGVHIVASPSYEITKHPAVSG